MGKSIPKVFKTISEQCNILIKQRNLNLTNSSGDSMPIRRLKCELIEKNYFDLVNGLDDIINNSPPNYKYYGNYSVYDLLELYDFNKKIRELILSTISEFEIRLKTSIAYHFSNVYSKHWNDYCNKNNYKKVTKNDINELFIAYYGYSKKYNGHSPKPNQKVMFPFFITNEKLIKKLKRKRRYLQAYEGQPPLWVAIKALDFGQLHKMFSLLKNNVAREVLSNFNFKISERNKFESVLYVINWLRNECAHFEMINKSKYHGKYPVDNDLIKDLKLRTSKSGMNLTLFQTMCILDSVQSFKDELHDLFSKNKLPKKIKDGYLKSIGYWEQCGWNL